MPRSWIYLLPKEQLAAIVTASGLDSAGTLDELRKRMSRYVQEHPTEFAVAEGDHLTAMQPIAHTPPPDGINPDAPIRDDAKVINQIRKWGCHFDGRDPVAFLERVQELNAGYGFSTTQLLRALPELLRGDVLLWYRNTREAWDTWEDFEIDFKSQYLPRRYRATLRREIMERRQKPGENFASYATVMMTLMRRAGGFPRPEQLERIYDNMNPEYKVYVRIDDICSIAELQERAAEFEDIERQRKDLRKAEKMISEKPNVASMYNRTECCWRCKQRGHTRFDCRRPAKKFCSQCGRDGVLTKECHPSASGNASGAEVARTDARPNVSAT